LTKRGLSTNGKKAQLVKRLLTALSAESGSELGGTTRDERESAERGDEEQPESDEQGETKKRELVAAGDGSEKKGKKAKKKTIPDPTTAQEQRFAQEEQRVRDHPSSHQQQRFAQDEQRVVGDRGYFLWEYPRLGAEDTPMSEETENNSPLDLRCSLCFGERAFSERSSLVLR
jgi:hypothetical protein